MDEQRRAVVFCSAGNAELVEKMNAWFDANKNCEVTKVIHMAGACRWSALFIMKCLTEHVR